MRDQIGNIFSIVSTAGKQSFQETGDTDVNEIMDWVITSHKQLPPQNGRGVNEE